MSFHERFSRILVTPRDEWLVIEAETTTTKSIYLRYVLPLAAIPALTVFTKASGAGISVDGSTVRTSIASGIIVAVVRYILTLVTVYILTIIIDALAPRFGGTKNSAQALKVAAYASTPSWVAAIYPLLKEASWLGLAGLYSLYLLFLGLPVLMKSPRGKSLAYTAVVAVCAVALFFVSGEIVKWAVVHLNFWRLWYSLFPV